MATGRYIPPALRLRPPQDTDLVPTHSSIAQQSPASLASFSSNPNPRTNSKTPWSSSPSGPGPSSLAYLESQIESQSHHANSQSQSQSHSHSQPRSTSASRSASGSGNPRTNLQGGPTGTTLHVFGDSFVGPLKLLSEDCVKVTTFKGASAKGLNNPNSLKQVSAELLPALNRFLAPPPYAYIPSSGRWVLLLFGNVDLQINYLWQLQTKKISSLSFSPNETTSTSAPSADDGLTGSDVETTEIDERGEDPDLPPTVSNVLASATETSSRGPALGPELFVHAILEAYTSWLEREVVNGPIGERLLSASKQRRESSSTTSNPASTSDSFRPSSRRRIPPPSKLLISSALPPLVEDDMLSRIVEKYVERLEGDHEKAQRALMDKLDIEIDGGEGNGSRTPWAVGSTITDDDSKPSDIQDTLSHLHLETPIGETPHVDSPMSSISANKSELSAELSEQDGVFTAKTSTSNSTSPPTTGISSDSNSSVPGLSKTPISALLEHDPPLCTRQVRVRMTNMFNKGLKAFCDLHPDVLGFVDISPDILTPPDPGSVIKEVRSVSTDIDLNNIETPTVLSDDRETKSEVGVKAETLVSGSQDVEADRSLWACPVDPTNIHPLWEPTLPLWLRHLGSHGVPTEFYRITDDAEETFKAYEADKRRRAAEASFGSKVSNQGEISRVKLRDE